MPFVSTAKSISRKTPNFINLSVKSLIAIQKHKENWDQLCLELMQIRIRREGRTEAVEGLTAEETFFDLARAIAFYGSEPSDEDVEGLKSCVSKMFEEFHNTIDIVNFWKNEHEIKKLEALLRDIFCFQMLIRQLMRVKRLCRKLCLLQKLGMSKSLMVRRTNESQVHDIEFTYSKSKRRTAGLSSSVTAQFH